MLLPLLLMCVLASTEFEWSTYYDDMSFSSLFMFCFSFPASDVSILLPFLADHFQVFISGQAILGSASEPPMAERIAIFCCRVFIYLGSMCRILYCNLVPRCRVDDLIDLQGWHFCNILFLPLRPSKTSLWGHQSGTVYPGVEDSDPYVTWVWNVLFFFFSVTSMSKTQTPWSERFWMHIYKFSSAVEFCTSQLWDMALDVFTLDLR